MAMSFMIRKASSRAVVPLAVRALTTSRPIISDHICFDPPVHKNLFNPSEIKIVDKQLYKSLKSRLKVAKLSPRVMPLKPTNFPFTYEFDPVSGSAITLKREIESEKIEIVANMPFGWKNNMKEEIISSSDSDSDSSDFDSSDSDSSKSDDSSDHSDSTNDNGLEKRSDEPWRLTVKVLKENGNALLFGIRASEAYEKGYEIDSMIVDKAGSEKTYKDPIWVGTLSSGVQEDLREYLDIRGLNEIDYEFLDEYLKECVAREKLILLSEVKQFVKGSEDIDATQEYNWQQPDCQEEEKPYRRRRRRRSWTLRDPSTIRHNLYY